MQYGGITLNHVLSFQIRIMMGNQYDSLVNAAINNDEDELIVACLRLGWNDAFRHVSKNIPEAEIISQCTSQGWNKLLKKRKPGVNRVDDQDKDTIIVQICRSLCEEFKEYASKSSTASRHAYIHEKMASEDFVSKFAVIKVVDPKESDKYLCFGHIQKMFNMAVKLYLCLKICAEEQESHDLQIILQFGATPEKNVLLKPEIFTLFSSSDTSADCPIDHYILEAIDREIDEQDADHADINPERRNRDSEKFASIAWSKLNAQSDTAYIDIQNKIAALQADSGKSNLCFDFEHWNSKH
jgi:hypothetical protein